MCIEVPAHVILASDLSRHAAGAKRAAVALAAPGVRIDTLTVLSPQAIEDTPALPLMTRAALAALQHGIRATGGRGEVRIEAGEAAQTIARVAADHDACLIVVGRHGRGWVRDVLIGSTAAQLCETAGRPVLVVPGADDR